MVATNNFVNNQASNTVASDVGFVKRWLTQGTLRASLLESVLTLSDACTMVTASMGSPPANPLTQICFHNQPAYCIVSYTNANEDEEEWEARGDDDHREAVICLGQTVKNLRLVG